MKLFAIELSSHFGSVTILENGRVAVERKWEQLKKQQPLFDALEEITEDWDSVDLFAVGRGPGAFSGMRVGFTVVNALARPGRKPMVAHNSCAALAARYGAKQTVVVGDAHRGKIWAGRFSGVELQGGFELMEQDELIDFVPEGARVASLGHGLVSGLLLNSKSSVPTEAVFPEAAELGRLVFERMQRGAATEPFEPLYMHPPVFSAPRFPAG